MGKRLENRFHELSLERKASSPSLSASPYFRADLSLAQIANIVQGKAKLNKFLTAVVPDRVPLDVSGEPTQSRDELIEDVFEGMKTATMAIRIT